MTAGLSQFQGSWKAGTLEEGDDADQGDLKMETEPANIKKMCRAILDVGPISLPKSEEAA